MNHVTMSNDEFRHWVTAADPNLTTSQIDAAVAHHVAEGKTEIACGLHAPPLHWSPSGDYPRRLVETESPEVSHVVEDRGRHKDQ